MRQLRRLLSVLVMAVTIVGMSMTAFAQESVSGAGGNGSITIENASKGIALDKEKDYCTLLTCTPYGINTKRLLVRGVRCEVTERAEPIRTGEKTYRRWYAAIGLNVFVAGVILCWKRKKKEEDKYK